MRPQTWAEAKLLADFRRLSPDRAEVLSDLVAVQAERSNRERALIYPPPRLIVSNPERQP